jgi:hypothetical protein
VARHRRRWRVWQRYVDSERFVFLDETAITTAMTRLSGWGPKGERLVDVAPAGHVWTPPPVQEESLNSCGAGSGAAMCPASAVAAHRPRARMGVRGSGPHHWSALEALSSHLVLLISHLVLLIPPHRRLRHTCPLTFSRHRQPHARRPLTRRRPELDNFRPWRSTPTRSAPSCWPAPPSPASAACGRAYAPARSPRARPCAAPSAPRHWPQ